MSDIDRIRAAADGALFDARTKGVVTPPPSWSDMRTLLAALDKNPNSADHPVSKYAAVTAPGSTEAPDRSSAGASGAGGAGTPEKMVAGDDGWTAWRHPLPGYHMICCDCGLAHEMEFLILRDREELPDGERVGATVDDPKLHIVFRARRA